MSTDAPGPNPEAAPAPPDETLDDLAGATLYQRIGGAEGLARLVDTFYTAVLADPELAPFFRNVAMDKLQAMQREFLAAALGGPQTYSGLNIAHAHSALGISAQHFGRFVRHIIGALEQMGVRRKDIDQIISRINLHVDEVVGYGPAAG